VVIQETIDNLEFFDRVPLVLVNLIVKYMIPRGYCIIYVAKFNNIPISISLFFIYGDMALYWAGTTNETGRKLNAHHLLMWEAIQYAKIRGCKIFNFGASPVNADSLMQFKKSWGTETHYYSKNQKVPALLYPFYKLREVFHG
jgi:lipid II:glycine glycyltransferase (peptidoglycan interpeptide bridge formation enzyme)